MAITLDGTNGITTPDVDSDGLTVDTNTLFVDAANNRVGVGTTAPADRLTVSGTNPALSVLSDSTSGRSDVFFRDGDGAAGRIRYEHSSDSMGLFTNGSEHARITSGGQFIVGDTTTPRNSSVCAIAPSTSEPLFVYRKTTSTGAGVLSLSSDVTSTAQLHFQILGNGNVLNTNNSYGSLSDFKLKENIADATPKLGKLNQVRVVTFNMVGDSQKQIGVIAQELEQIFPSLITDRSDYDAEGNDLGTVTKSVKYSVFVPMLIKAMQEQQAIIEALEARVAALETNA
jgi:hypothetical protein